MKLLLPALLVCLLLPAAASAQPAPLPCESFALELRAGADAAEVVAHIRRVGCAAAPTAAERVQLQSVGLPGTAAVLAAMERHALPPPPPPTDEEERRRAAVDAEFARARKQMGDGTPTDLTARQMDLAAKRQRLAEINAQLAALNAAPSGAAPADPRAARRQQVIEREIRLQPGEHVHLIKYGGPNEFMTFVERDVMRVRVRVGTHLGIGEAKDVRIRTGFEGTRTPVYSDGYGCTVYWVETLKRRGTEGTFLAEFQPGALYRKD